MEDPVIRAEALGKRFGPVKALDGLDLQVPAGWVLALLGRNGAGKTTLVRILATLLRPDTGRAWVAGLDVVAQAASVRRVIGVSGQYAALDGYLTGRENLRMVGRLAGLPRARARGRADDRLERLGLTAVADRAARTYSGGTRRRLDLAAALVATPQVLFLDEPTTGLDAHGRAELRRLLAEVTGQGSTLLLTTQYLEEADRVADQIVVLDCGQVLAAGTAAQLRGRLGGDRLELVAAAGQDPGALAAALDGLGGARAEVDRDLGRVVLPASDGPGILADVVTRLAAADLRIADLALRRPSLEDVFLTLTGTHPGPGGQSNPSVSTTGAAT